MNRNITYGVIAAYMGSILLLSGCGSVTASAVAVQPNTSAVAVQPNAAAATVQPSTSEDVQEKTTQAVITPAAESSAAAAAETETQESAPPEAEIIMVGDILLHTPVEECAQSDADGTYDFTPIFAHTADEIASADLALVNQEVMIGGEELGISGYPAFNAPTQIGDALAQSGFDVICHATNHALDKGKQGILNCTSFWRETYPEIAVLGIADSQEMADTIYVTEVEGIKIAILNYTYGTNGINLPKDMTYAVNLWDEDTVRADIATAKEMADVVIVCPHWGTEYRLTASDQQQQWCELMLSCGVDLVLGTHPHVIEPIEVLTGADDHQMLVYYSLGNFVNWTSGRGEGVANRMVGGMAKVTLARDEQGEVYIADYGVRALVCDVHKGDGGVSVYPLSDYTEKQAQENEICTQDANFTLQYCRDLCDTVWGDLWE